MAENLYAVFKRSEDPEKFIPWEFAGFTTSRQDVQDEVDFGEVKVEDVRVFDFDAEGYTALRTQVVKE